MRKGSGNLLKYLSRVPDPRRLQGQRHELQHILLITLMSIMSGYIGYRAIGDFMRRNKSELIAALQPKKGKLPSFDVVRAVLIAIDFQELSKQFYNWARQYVSIENKEWISIDGKAIGGTVTGSHSIDQSFISLVSLYCSKKKLVIGNAVLVNSKQSGIPVVQQLIEALDLKGVVFTLDALHCQKKRQKLS
ncbi:MAG: ISAs1 family transposase [Parafilimonas sp.]